MQQGTEIMHEKHLKQGDTPEKEKYTCPLIAFSIEFRFNLNNCHFKVIYCDKFWEDLLLRYMILDCFTRIYFNEEEVSREHVQIY